MLISCNIVETWRIKFDRLFLLANQACIDHRLKHGFTVVDTIKFVSNCQAWFWPRQTSRSLRKEHKPEIVPSTQHR